MKLIPLTKGYFAKVDDVDFESLSQLNWHAVPRTRKDGVVTCVYACRKSSSIGGKKRFGIYMHRQILDLHTTRKPDVDHRDTNGLNNQRENLRISTRSNNLANARLRIDNKSSRRGVRWDPKNNKWRSEITVNGKLIWLGRFVELEDASRAHEEAAVKFFGEFHRESGRVASLSVGD